MKLFNIRLVLLCIFSMPQLLFAEPIERCPRGSLDLNFCDQNGDLLADSPKDPAKWIDPYPLVFAYSPVEDPAIYKKAWSDFIDHLSRVTQRKVKLFPIQSNAAEIQAMRIGKIHVAGFNTGSNPLAVNCAGFHPFTLMAKDNGSFGYEMEILTYPGSGIQQVSDIQGKTMIFTAPTSNSGFKAASAILQDEFDLQKGKDFDFSFSGRHSKSIIGIKNKTYQLVSVASSVRKRMLKRGDISEQDYSVIYRSKTFPNTGFGYLYNLNPALIKKIKQAFETFQWDTADGMPSSLKAEFSSSGYQQFVPISYKKDWEIIRRIDKVNKITYSCS